MSNRFAALTLWLLACVSTTSAVVWVARTLTPSAHSMLVLLLSAVGVVLLRSTIVVTSRLAAALCLAFSYVFLTLWLGVTATWLIRWLLDRHISFATVGGIYAVLLLLVARDAMMKRDRPGYVSLVVFGEHTTNGEGE